MPTYISLNSETKNPPVRQQSIVDIPYEYTYWLPVISSSSTIAATQNAALGNGGLLAVTFTDRTNNVIMIVYSSGTSNPHGTLGVTFVNDGVPVDNFTFLINSSVGNIVLFKTEEIDTVRISNSSGVTLGVGLFVGVGSLVKVPDHPYI